MSEKYKVAVATSDGKTVDSHFGHVQSFLIFEVDEESGKAEDIGERDVTAAQEALVEECSLGATLAAAATTERARGTVRWTRLRRL